MAARAKGPDMVLFTATTGRTGTTSLVDLFRDNVPDCVAEHEPAYRPEGIYEHLYRAFYLRHLSSLEKRGFGRVLQWRDRDDPVLIRLASMRARRIRRMGCQVYLESSHAFLSALGDAMVREFPGLGLIHLVRDPLEVAVSYCNRNTHPAGSPEFLAALGRWHPHPDSRQNCLRLPVGEWSCFQHYLWVWLEAELRCLEFLKRYPSVGCFHLDTQDLNDPVRIAAMFEFFGIPAKSNRLAVVPVRNCNSAETRVSERHFEEASTLLCCLDPDLLGRLPYRYGLEEIARA